MTSVRVPVNGGVRGVKGCRGPIEGRNILCPLMSLASAFCAWYEKPDPGWTL